MDLETATPRFLQRLYAEDQRRRKEQAASLKTRMDSSESGAEPSSASSASSVSYNVGAGTRIPVPPLCYSSSSATSSEPPNDLLKERERERDREQERDSASYSYGYHTDAESSGYSSDESISASPALKSAFSSPTFGISCHCHQSHHNHHYQQSPSPPYSVPQFSFPKALQPLNLPPPSLDLSAPPSVPPPYLALAANDVSITDLTVTTTSTAACGYSSSAVTTTSTDDEVLTPSRETLVPPFADDALLQPPENFAMIYPSVYRSSFPLKKHYTFLRSLGLKTVLTLVQDEYPEANRTFFRNEGIRFHQIGIPGNKEPFVYIPDESIRSALAIVLDARNHPMLIHCNKGKHRTGCLVGCLRKMQCWSSTAIFEEYRKFSYPKSRAMDQLFIELFQPVSLASRPILVLTSLANFCICKGLAMHRCG